jgi:hypothetical protein
MWERVFFKKGEYFLLVKERNGSFLDLRRRRLFIQERVRSGT